MNRHDLAVAISGRMGIATSEAMDFIETFEQIVRATLSNGEEVSMFRFGRFHRRKLRARIGRHPHTGEPITLPARYVPAFSPGKSLKETLDRTL